MARLPPRLLPGLPYPLGSRWDGLGINFAVFSAHADKIELCLFDPSGRREIARYALPEYTNEVWHGYLPDVAPGLLYGYRAYGPYDPRNGHRFNHHKLLLDPYAQAFAGTVKWNDALFGYRLHSTRADLSFDRRDTAMAMPKSIVVDDPFHWGDHSLPNRPWSETVIYEAHVRGLTMLFDEVPSQERGTFAALGHPRVIEHLRRLGVTALELLPIHAYLQDRALLEKGLSNYWGYNTLSFFAPERRYFSTGALNELRIAIRRLHAAGIEVILDVVYNHTCEGNELGPTLSFRGLDNASYYRLHHDNLRHCVNDTGTGNTLNLSHPCVLQLVLDSLRYWSTAFQVDGFRFDLGVTLGREFHGFDEGAGFFDALRQDPVLGRRKLIFEPWDIGPGGYHLGQHPPGSAEWNDRFRDTARRFWRGDPGMCGEMGRRLSGSGDIFDRAGRRPWASINFATSHDGFTLHDLTSYEVKHNEANGEDNADGHNHNYACNWGVEGPTEDDEILAMRERVKRSLLTTVFLSLGTPMLLAGDELCRTQLGNNNAYCQDNEVSWLDWELLRTEAGASLARFVARLTALRRQHPVIRSERFLHGQEKPHPEIPDIDWFDMDGKIMEPEDWDHPEMRSLVMRRAGLREDGSIEVIALLLNASAEALQFRLPPPALVWRVLIDSADPDGLPRKLDGDEVTVEDRAAVVVGAILGSGTE
ncbi:MAG: glycogen operon protein GlgX homolog [Alphaproteobacteria bacterium]|nr:MAG: glycogen operon protein GlgX homolog [Alphaproteobacteria bacterium]